MASATNAAAVGSELTIRLEAMFRLLGRRVFGPSAGPTANGGMDRASAALLAVLDSAAEPARPSDLAAALELDLSTVSRRLCQLEERE